MFYDGGSHGNQVCVVRGRLRDNPLGVCHQFSTTEILMVIKCAWCNPMRVIGEIEPFSDTRESHGICPDCAAQMKQEFLARKIREARGMKEAP